MQSDKHDEGYVQSRGDDATGTVAVDEMHGVSGQEIDTEAMECRNGPACIFLASGTCKYYHPSSDVECRYGRACHFYAMGTCKFRHGPGRNDSGVFCSNSGRWNVLINSPCVEDERGTPPMKARENIDPWSRSPRPPPPEYPMPVKEDEGSTVPSGSSEDEVAVPTSSESDEGAAAGASAESLRLGDVLPPPNAGVETSHGETLTTPSKNVTAVEPRSRSPRFATGYEVTPDYASLAVKAGEVIDRWASSPLNLLDDEESPTDAFIRRQSEEDSPTDAFIRRQYEEDSVQDVQGEACISISEGSEGEAQEPAEGIAIQQND